jgi:hypothetical protein
VEELHGRRLKVVVAAIVVVAVGALIWTQRPRDATDRSTVSGAVRDFNDGQDRETRTLWDGFPKPGVYRYSTRGGESIDTPVLGTAHDYDGVSTVTILPVPCGLEERWQVLATRWSKVRVCRDGGGAHLESISEYREFFGTEQGVRFGCDGSSVPMSRSMVAGMRWRTRCGAEDGSTSNRSEVVGLVRIRVGKRSIEAVRVHTVGVLRGENEGTTVRTEWLRPSDGLLLRRTVNTKTSFDFVGGGDYEERYTLALLSTSPLS